MADIQEAFNTHGLTDVKETIQHVCGVLNTSFTVNGNRIVIQLTVHKLTGQIQIDVCGQQVSVERLLGYNSVAIDCDVIFNDFMNTVTSWKLVNVYHNETDLWCRDNESHAMWKNQPPCCFLALRKTFNNETVWVPCHELVFAEKAEQYKDTDIDAWTASDRNPFTEADTTKEPSYRVDHSYITSGVSDQTSLLMECIKEETEMEDGYDNAYNVAYDTQEPDGIMSNMPASTGSPSMRREEKEEKVKITRKEKDMRLSKKQSLKCRYCGKLSLSKANLMLHVKNHLDLEIQPECAICKHIFTSPEELAAHMTLHLTEEVHKCFACGKIFVTKDKLRRHMQRFHPDGGQPEIEEVSNMKKKWQEPSRICHLCGKMIKSSLKAHLRSHSDEKMFKCSECERSFKRKLSLVHHMGEVHKTDSEKPYKCGICGKGFMHEHTKNYHQLSHSTLKNHQCEICGRRFVRKKYLQQHKKIHLKLERTHCCNICGRMFADARRLTSHKDNMHSGQRICEVCGAIFNSKYQMNVHMWKQHPSGHPQETQWRCEVCKEEFSSKRSLSKHQFSSKHYPDDMPYMCGMCERTFLTEEILNEHMTLHEQGLINNDSGSPPPSPRQTQDGPRTCTFCTEGFATFIDLKVHVRKVHKPAAGTAEKPACKICGKMITAGYMKDHVLRHGTPTLPCKTCGKLFFTTTDLQVHKRIHTGQRPYQCETCGNAYTKRSHLNVHMRSHDPHKAKAYVCQVCGCRFFNQKDLKNHKETHSRVELETPVFANSADILSTVNADHFSCDLCNRTFKTYNFMMKHKLLHNQVKDLEYRCNVCGESQKSKLQLINHKKAVHDGKTLLRCSFCDKELGTKQSLRRHMRSHTTPKPHVCETCGKSYRDRVYFEKHKLEHTGQKAFTCSVCNKGFTWHGHLTTHMRSHHGQQPYKCSLCELSFTYAQGLQKHMTTHKDGEILPSSDNLHQEQEHNAKHFASSYSCVLCNQGFQTQDTLLQHQQTAHQVQQIDIVQPLADNVVNSSTIYIDRANVVTWLVPHS